MTYEEAAVLAMARTDEITNTYPSNRMLMYRRMGLRQRALQTAAAKINPDYYGVCAESPLDENTATDLNDIVTPVPTPELIEMVTIADPGTSAWEADQEVFVVPQSQLDAELPPRATLRDLVLQGVGTDLVGVVSLEIHYSRLADVPGTGDAATAVELISPYDELLVIDCHKMLLTKATRLDAAIKAAALESLNAEESALEAKYMDHVRSYAPLTTRFARRVARGS